MPGTRERGQAVAHQGLWVQPAYLDALRAAGLDSADALFAATGDANLDKPGLASWRERIRITLNTGDDRHPTTCFLKRFTNPPTSARREVRRAGCGAASVAGLEWTWLHRLRAAGIPCPQPIALAEVIEHQKELRSALLMAAVPGEALERLLPTWTRDDRPLMSKANRLSADLVARLHGSGYFHRDLYLSHLFFDLTSSASELLHLIDLQRIIRPEVGRYRWMVKDLASMNYSAPAPLITATDRLRWLKAYLGVPKLDAWARRLCYRVIGKSQRIARHDRRRRSRVQSQ